MAVPPSYSAESSHAAPAPAAGSATPATPSSPQPRRIATPRWLDVRLVLGVLLVLASVLVGAVVVSHASVTYPVVAATQDLAAGTVLTSGDVSVHRVQLPDHGRGVYLTDTSKAVGQRLDRAVSRDELLPVDAVTAANARHETLVKVTVPLASGAAPSLRTGQRIEVWLSSAACASVVLLPDVTVQSVHADNGSAFSSGTGGQDVVVDVVPTAASRVIQALAIDAAQLRAGILLGDRAPAASPSPSASGVPGSASGTGQPDLASCGSASPTQ